MKCPKCSYNSFELYDSCRKCGTDLTAFKQSHGIRAIVHPPQFLVNEPLPAGAFAPEVAAAVAVEPETAPAAGDAISWDLPADKGSSAEDGFAGFDLDFSMDEEQEGDSFSFEEEAGPQKDDEAAFGEFSFDDDDSGTGSVGLDDLLKDSPSEAMSTASTPDEFDFDGEEFSLETNSIPLEVGNDQTQDFDMDDMLADGSSKAEEKGRAATEIDLKDLTDDWPSFFEEEPKEESKK